MQAQRLQEIDLRDKFCFVGKTEEELSLVCLKIRYRTLRMKSAPDGEGSE